MESYLPPKESVTALVDFFNSLIEKIDNTLDNKSHYSSLEEISHNLGTSLDSSTNKDIDGAAQIVCGEPVAYEEVPFNCSSLHCGDIVENNIINQGDIDDHYKELSSFINKFANDYCNIGDDVLLLNQDGDLSSGKSFKYLGRPHRAGK